MKDRDRDTWQADALFILTPQPATTPTQLPSPMAGFHATITDGSRDSEYSYSNPTDTRTEKNDSTPAFYGLNPLQTESIASC